MRQRENSDASELLLRCVRIFIVMRRKICGAASEKYGGIMFCYSVRSNSVVEQIRLIYTLSSVDKPYPMLDSKNGLMSEGHVNTEA